MQDARLRLGRGGGECKRGSQAYERNNSVEGHGLASILEVEIHTENSRKNVGNLSLQHKYSSSELFAEPVFKSGFFVGI